MITVSTDKTKLNVAFIQNFLKDIYWAAGRTIEEVQTTIDASVLSVETVIIIYTKWVLMARHHFQTKRFVNSKYNFLLLQYYQQKSFQ